MSWPKTLCESKAEFEAVAVRRNFILMQIKLIFKRKVLHLTSFSKMKFSEIESVLLLFKSSRMRRESETGVWHRLRWHILTSTKDKTVPRPLLSCNHTFFLVTRFLAHAGNPETKVLSYLCWIYFCVFLSAIRRSIWSSLQTPSWTSLAKSLTAALATPWTVSRSVTR